jgi:hypothetical protein
MGGRAAGPRRPLRGRPSDRVDSSSGRQLLPASAPHWTQISGRCENSTPGGAG